MKMKRLAETPPQTTIVSSYSSSSLLTTLDQEIIYTHILTRLDGESLAALSWASSELRLLCSDEKLWRKICTAKWPSLLDPIATDVISTFPGGHRSFFLDAFPSPPRVNLYLYPPPPEAGLILAVDIYCQQGPPFFSTVERIKNTTNFFISYVVNASVFVPIDDQPVQEKYEEWVQKNMRLSWIVIDPSQKRAANLSRRYNKTIVFTRNGEFMIPYWVETVEDKMVERRVRVVCRWNPIRNLLCVRSVDIDIPTDFLGKSSAAGAKRKNTR